jgi:hypothetical protein
MQITLKTHERQSTRTYVFILADAEPRTNEIAQEYLPETLRVRFSTVEIVGEGDPLTSAYVSLRGRRILSSGKVGRQEVRERFYSISANTMPDWITKIVKQLEQDQKTT